MAPRRGGLTFTEQWCLFSSYWTEDIQARSLERTGIDDVTLNETLILWP